VSARTIGVVGTLVMTRFLAPDVVGEVAAASVLAFTASMATSFGLGNYLIVKGKEGSDVAFHVTFHSLILGGIGLLAAWALGDAVAAAVGVPGMAPYVPGMVLAVAIRRLGSVPDKVLVAQLRFHAVGLALILGEATYTATAVALAAAGWGGHAIVVGNIVQSTVMTAVVCLAVSWRDWLLPCRIAWVRTRDLFRFGVPLGVMATAKYAASNWDNLLYARFFGAHQMGLYRLGYNLAELPALQVGEHVSTVLLPSLVKLEAAARKDALVRATSLLALIIFPMALGIAAISSSLIEALLNEEWQGVAPVLAILSAVSVFRPVSWAVSSFLVAEERTRMLLVLELGKLGLVGAGIALLAGAGALWACVGVGGAFALHAAASVWIVTATSGIAPARFWHGMLGPLLACAPMVGAVMGVRAALAAAGVYQPALSLVLEIAVGAAVYVPMAFVLATDTAHDFLGLCRKAFARAESTAAAGSGTAPSRAGADHQKPVDHAG
jgi:PST family polysaccharide transporter